MHRDFVTLRTRKDNLCNFVPQKALKEPMESCARKEEEDMQGKKKSNEHQTLCEGIFLYSSAFATCFCWVESVCFALGRDVCQMMGTLSGIWTPQKIANNNFKE